MSDDSLVSMAYPVFCYSKSTAPGIQGDSDVPFHKHDGFEFYLFLGGSVNFSVGDSVFSPIRGDLFILEPELTHRAISRGPQQYDRFIINVRKDRMKEFLSQDAELAKSFEYEGSAPFRSVRLNADGIEEYCSIAEKLSYAVYLRKPCDDLLVDAYLTEILILISRQLSGERVSEGQGAVPDLVADVKNYIFDHLTEQIVLEDLSKQFYFNGKYISAMFKKYTGMTLRSYILEQRIMLAKRLLREGSNVSEACYHSGFLDYTNFIRSFTRTVGMSPGKYRGAQGRVRSESFELCRFDSIFVGAAFYGLKIAAKHDIIYSRKGESI